MTDEPIEVMTPRDEPQGKNGQLVEVADQAVYRTLFQADDPRDVLERARSLVAYIDKLIQPRRQDYITTIQGKPYAMAQWWSANDIALGITHNNLPVQAFESAHVSVEAYTNRCELFYASGKLLGSAEAMITADEPNSRGRQHFELFSKVQTRAFVKANRLSLALLPALAGLEAIAAEEVVEEPIMWPGDEIDLNALPDDVKIGLKSLGWGQKKSKLQLAKFLQSDGSIDEAAALAHLSAEIDKLNAR